MSSSNAGVEEDEDPSPATRPSFHPHSPVASPPPLPHVVAALSPTLPPANDAANAKTTLSPAIWDQQATTIALPAAVASNALVSTSAAPPNIHSSTRRRSRSRAAGTTRSTSKGANSRDTSRELDVTPNVPLGESASSSSTFRVICVPDKPASTSYENSLDPQRQPQQEQREQPQDEHRKQGGTEPRKEEEEEELDKREEEEDTPPPPPVPPPKRIEPILKPIPSPPWASDGFRPDDPPPPRKRTLDVGGAGRGRADQLAAELGPADRYGTNAGRGSGSASGSGAARREMQAEAPTRGPYAHAPRARGSISGGNPAPAVKMPVAVPAATAPRQAPYPNPYTQPYPYSNPNLQPYPNTNTYPYPASYNVASNNLPRRENYARESSSDSGERRNHARGSKASAAREAHRPLVKARPHPVQNQHMQQQHQTQIPQHPQQPQQPRYAEEQPPHSYLQQQQQQHPPPPKRSYASHPDQTLYPHAPYSNPINQQSQQPQPPRRVATAYNPGLSSPRKRTRSQSPFHPPPPPPPPPPWYTSAQTQEHTRAFANAPARGSMSGAVAPLALRKTGSGAVLEAVASAAGVKRGGSGAIYASLELSPSPSPVPRGYARRVQPRAGRASWSRSRSRSRGRNASLIRGRSISMSRSRSTSSSSRSWRGRNASWSRNVVSVMQDPTGSGSKPVSGPARRWTRGRQSGSEMDVDEEPSTYPQTQKGKGKEREQERHHVRARGRSASLSPMREDTDANAGAAARRTQPDPHPHPSRWIDTSAPGPRPAWDQPTTRPPPASASRARATSQAQAQGATSPPSATSAHYEYDYAIEHSPPAPAYATLQEEPEERREKELERGRREYSQRGVPYMPASPSPSPPEQRVVAQPEHMRRPRSRSIERGGYPPYVPAPTRNPYHALTTSAPIGIQSYAYLAAQPRQFCPPPLHQQQQQAREGYANAMGQEQEPPPSTMPLRRSTTDLAPQHNEAFSRGQRSPTRGRLPSPRPRRGFPRGGSPAYQARQPQHQNKSQFQHQTQSQHLQLQPPPASGMYAHQQMQEAELAQQQRLHLQSLRNNYVPSNQQPVSTRPPPPSSQVQPVHRVIVPAPGPAAVPSTVQSPTHARAQSSTQAPAQTSSSPYAQRQAPRPPTPPPPPQPKPRTPRVRKPPPPKASGTSEFDRPHPNPTVSMRTIPQPPPQLVAQQLAAQLGIPMGSTDLRGTLPPTVGDASGAGTGSPSASAAADTTVVSMRSGLGGDTILPPDLQVGAHLTQAADATRLSKNAQKIKHRKSQSVQSAGDGASSSRMHQPTSSTSTASSAAAGPSTAPPEQQPMQFGPLQHFQTTLFPQEHLLLDMHSVGGAQFVLKPPRSVKGGRGVYGSYGVVLDGVTGVPLNVGGIVGVDAGRSGGAEGSGSASANQSTAGPTAAGGSGGNAKNGSKKGTIGGTGGGSAGGHAEPGDEGGLLHNVLVVKRRRVPGGAQEFAAPDPAAGGPLVVGGRLMTPPPGEGRAGVVHASAVAAAAASAAVALAASEGRGKARGRPKSVASGASGKGKEREGEGEIVQDRRPSMSADIVMGGSPRKSPFHAGQDGNSKALGSAEAPLTISDDDDDSRVVQSHGPTANNTNSVPRPARSPDAPPIQVHIEDSPSNANDAPDESDSQSEEEDELESEDSNGGVRYPYTASPTHARTASALLPAPVPTPDASLRRSTRTSPAPSTSRSSSNTRSAAGPAPSVGGESMGKNDPDEQHAESPQNSIAPDGNGSLEIGGGNETNTFAAPARPSRKGKQYSCDVCDQVFTRSGDVRRHKDTRHNTEGSGGCRCPFCGRVLTRQDALQRHWDRYCRRKSKRHLDRSRGGQASGMGVYGLMHRSYLDPLPQSSYFDGRLMSNGDETNITMTMTMAMVQGGSTGRASTGASRASSPSGSHSRSSSAYGRRLPQEGDDDEDGEDEDGIDPMDVDMDAGSAESARRGSTSAEKESKTQYSDQPNESGMEMSGVE